MTVLQLELNLRQQLTEAQRSPQAVDWQQLCLAFDEAIAQTLAGQKLATAADAMQRWLMFSQQEPMSFSAHGIGSGWRMKGQSSMTIYLLNLFDSRFIWI
jgi:hypothetical protein